MLCVSMAYLNADCTSSVPCSNIAPIHEKHDGMNSNSSSSSSSGGWWQQTGNIVEKSKAKIETNSVKLLVECETHDNDNSKKLFIRVHR